MKHNTRFMMRTFTMALAGVLLLSGCVTIRSETTIKSDGSGSRSITMAISKDMLALINQAGNQAGTPSAQPSDPFADAKTNASKIPGAQVDPFTDPTSGDQGVKITIPFKSLDDLKAQQATEKDQSLDAITYTQLGNVVTLNAAINTSQLANQASAANGGGTPEPTVSATKSPAEEALATQMMGSMFEFSYSLAVPGKILDWGPKENATYDAATNKLTWKLDLTNSKMPEIMVKWDNSMQPVPIQMPTPAMPAETPTTTS